MTAFPPVGLVEGIAAPLLCANVDTDAIIPSREIRVVGKTGLADGLFAGWRYKVAGERDPDPDFVLNDPRYARAPILLSGANFGCGSSREHAVWALHEYGYRAVIAPSFAPIFRANCIRNGIIPVVLDAADIVRIANTAAPVTVDLVNLRVTAPGLDLPFAISEEARAMLVGGLDAIDLTMTQRNVIADFHARDRAARPWIYI